MGKSIMKKKMITLLAASMLLQYVSTPILAEEETSNDTVVSEEQTIEDVPSLEQEAIPVEEEKIEAEEIVVPETSDATLVANGTIGNIYWKVSQARLLTIEGSGNFNEYGFIPPWYDYKDYITKADVNLTDTTDASYMFFGLKNLRSVDFTDFDTSNLTYTDYMFSGCLNLKELDLSEMNTSKVTTMNGMFQYCSALESLILTDMNTSNVQEMGYMFDGCASLTELDLSKFNT